MKNILSGFEMLQRMADATETAGGTMQTRNQSAAVDNRPDPVFDPRINIDARDRNSQVSRQPNFTPIPIVQATRYIDRRGNPRVAFNGGGLHLSMAQLQSQGVFMPEILIGKNILVDFFQRGDILINGTIVKDDGVLPNQFVIEQDIDAARQLQVKFAEEAQRNFAGQVAFAYGSNRRGRGVGTQQNTTNGVVNTGNIRQMQDPATSNTGSSSNAMLETGNQLNRTGNDQTVQTDANKTQAPGEGEGAGPGATGTAGSASASKFEEPE